MQNAADDLAAAERNPHPAGGENGPMLPGGNSLVRIGADFYPGGERGIRILEALMESVTYREHNPTDPIKPVVPRKPLIILHHETML